MILSVVIPTYTMDQQHVEMTMKCINSLKTKKQPNFELIVSEDAGLSNKEIITASTSYIYNTKNGGFTVNVNRGWRQATGDYVAIVSSDTYLISGSLLNLCIPNKITSPAVSNQKIEGFAGCFFVVPKNLASKYGMLDERMHTYYSDEEYKQRTKDVFLKINSVVIHHAQAQTVTPAGFNNPEQQLKDRKAYEAIFNPHNVS